MLQTSEEKKSAFNWHSQEWISDNLRPTISIHWLRMEEIAPELVLAYFITETGKIEDVNRKSILAASFVGRH